MQEENKEKQRDIALISLNVFAEKGFEATSIQQLSLFLGMGKSTLYDYFNSKEDLIYHAIKAWFDSYRESLQMILEGISCPEEKIRTFVRECVNSLEKDPSMVQLLLSVSQWLLSMKQDARWDVFLDSFDDFRKDIVAILLEGISIGVFKPSIAMDTEKIAINLIAYLDGIAIHFYLSKDKIKLKEQVDYYLDSLLKNIAFEKQ